MASSQPSSVTDIKVVDRGQELPSSDAAVIARELTALHGVEIREVDIASFAILPAGKRIESLKPLLDSFREKPARRIGSSTVTTVDSLITLIARFKSSQSVVFADPSRSGPKLTAVFDYHPASADTTEADNLGHRAVYAPALSDEWKAWAGKNGVSMAQGDFALFIEDRLMDISVANLDDSRITTFAKLVGGKFAEPSDIVGLSRGLQINVDSTVRNAVNTSTGEISVIFTEQHRDGAGEPISVPNLFVIAIPVFYAGPLYRIPVRLRYRNNGGKLSWHYQLVNPELSFDHAFTEITKKVEIDAGIPVILGAAEK